jgi:hypothetical protein
MQDVKSYEEDRAIERAQDIIRMTECGLNRNMLVYPRGVKVGCTYITRDAVREIWRRFEQQQ